MNSIARIILRGVVSGHVALTPEVLAALKDACQDLPGTNDPANHRGGDGSSPGIGVDYSAG